MADELMERPTRERMLAFAQKSDFNPKTYEYSDLFQPFDGNPLNAHTIAEMLECLNKDGVEIEAKVLAAKDGKIGARLFENKTQFLEALKKNEGVRLRESFDAWGYDMEGSSGSLYGQESIPLIGGPFYKQLYYYDYIRMHNLAFYAYHHDPLARAIVQVTRDFTLGRGFRVDVEDPKELALWRAFEEANDLQAMMDQIALEISIYGETMLWWLPNNDTKIAYRVAPGQEPSKGIIPRVRTIDPSVIWEIITYPEDITRVLAYQWVAPTQYQIYTARDGGSSVPGSKFIYQQIPAPEVQHYKINSVSNEKRGRSDLFPVLGYLKRLRDAVNYSIIAMQKQSAWCVDTEIDGAPEDIDQYTADLQSQLAMPLPGGEFVHSSKVKRTYLSNTAGKAGGSDAFDWCLSMIAAGTGIPVSYFGTHLSGGQTRASAMIATEPVAKKFQMRQGMYERIIKAMGTRLGIKSMMEVTFPELIIQDRSAKMKDLALAETQRWISRQTAAEIAAKELHITEFNYEEEQAQMEEPPTVNPLTAPGLEQPEPMGISSQDRKDVADADRAGG